MMPSAGPSPGPISDDDRFVAGELEDIPLFSQPKPLLHEMERLPDGKSFQMGWWEMDEPGNRLIAFAYHGSYDYVDDPSRDEQQHLVESLAAGEADSPVKGVTEDLWRTIFAVVRSDRFSEGTIATHAHALTRLANELRRRVIADRQRSAR